MNKTISVNISGFVFNIEEQAYEQLKEYLDKIRLNFSNEEERDEIMDDIELRIAELFQEKINHNKEVITEIDISKIIEILGLPEDFASDEDEGYTDTEEKEVNTEATTIRKRLFRDKDNANIGGVCSGLGHYFEVDVVVFRIIFVFLFIMFGSGVLLYLILLVVVPVAKTTAEKIEMKGQFVNVESIKDHLTNVKQAVTDEDNQSRIKSNVKNIVDKGLRVGHTTFQALSKVIGIGMTLGGIIFFIFLMFVIFGNTGLFPFIGEDRIESIPTLIEVVYPGENPSSFIFISFLMVLIIPIISSIIIGVRVLLNYRQNIKKLAISLTIIWTVAACILFAYSVELASHLKSSKEIRYSVPLEDASNDILIVDVLNDDQFSNHIDPYDDWESTELVKVDENNIYFGFPQVRVRTTSDTGEFVINLYKSSHGVNTRDAIDKIEHIEYKIQNKGNRVFIPPYLKMPRADKLRAQYVIVEIVIPTGKMVKFGDKIDRVIKYDYNQQLPWEKSYVNTEWYNIGNRFSSTNKRFNQSAQDTTKLIETELDTIQ